VDEADMVLSGGFEKDSKQLLATIRNQPLVRTELNNFKLKWTKEDLTDQDFVSSVHRQAIFSAISFPYLFFFFLKVSQPT
jgi:hypothetical protein